MLTHIEIFPVSEDEINGVGEISAFFLLFLFLVVFERSRLADQFVQHRALLVTKKQSILKFLLDSFILLFLLNLARSLWFLLFEGLVLSDVVIEILKSWTVEFAYLFEPLFQFHEFEFRQIFMKILGD